MLDMEQLTKGANTRRKRVYEVALEMLADGEALPTHRIRETLEERYGRAEWTNRQVGIILSVLVSKGILEKEKCRKDWTLITFYRLSETVLETTFKYLETPTRKHELDE
jgi:predicted transcriptional regulator